MNKTVFISLFIFLCFVVLLEGTGWVIHKLHYDRDGYWLQSDLDFDTVLKFLTYQLIIFTLAWKHKSVSSWIFTELFWWTCTQDIFFFGYGGFIFPEGDWTWMPLYPLLGHWTTLDQFVLSVGVLTTATLSIAVLKNALPKRVLIKNEIK